MSAPSTPTSPDHHWVVTFSCTDGPGIVHAISAACVAARGNITELQQFSSVDTGHFFLRLQLQTALDREQVSALVQDVADGFHRASFGVHELGRPIRTLVLASKAGHCLNDLLFRQRSAQLPIDVVRVLANHPDLEPMSRFFDVAFEAHPVTEQTKPAFEARVSELVTTERIDLVVLARYMQILSPQLCAQLTGKAINIHHSFLPGFKGANPYRQAHARGVKLIGATAHFVTADLDEGPIIEQNVVRVDHTRTPSQLIAVGQGEESRTLTEAVALFAERRVFLDGARTVIFR